MSQLVLRVTLALFSALTAIALWQHGYCGIIAPHFRSTGAGQVFADLTIALSLIMVWIWRDATTSGRRAWPWVLVTLALGSIGPLLYLLTRPASLRSRGQTS